jgi:hypothetical protein
VDGVDDAAPTDAGVPAELEIISAERLNLFADAVAAIAITVLALDLPVPVGEKNADVWRDLRQHVNDYIAFLISFAVIGRYWLVHHRIFVHLGRVSSALARWTMLWLLMIVLTPFATRVIVGDGGFGVRFTIYASVQALASILLLVAVLEMDRGGLAPARHAALGVPQHLLPHLAGGHRVPGLDPAGVRHPLGVPVLGRDPSRVTRSSYHPGAPDIHCGLDLRSRVDRGPDAHRGRAAFGPVVARHERHVDPGLHLDRRGRPVRPLTHDQMVRAEPGHHRAVD